MYSPLSTFCSVMSRLFLGKLPAPLVLLSWHQPVRRIAKPTFLSAREGDSSHNVRQPAPKADVLPRRKSLDQGIHRDKWNAKHWKVALFVVYLLLICLLLMSTTCCLKLVVYFMLSTTCCLLRVVYYLLSKTCCLLHFVYYLLSTTCCLLLVV